LKVLALILGAHEAAMIVVSGSMQPYLGIGDVVVLHSSNEINTTYIDVNANIKNIPIRKYLTPIYAQDETIGYPVISDLNILGQIVKPNKTADVVVYYSDLEKKEIIHRAILGINANDGTFYITQGDNKKTNFVLDSDCDAKFQTPTGIITINCLYPYALQKENILSKYFFNIPYIGWIKLAPVYLFGWRP
jgi:signal peptidase I